MTTPTGGATGPRPGAAPLPPKPPAAPSPADRDGTDVDGLKSGATLAHKALADVYDARVDLNNLKADQRVENAARVEAETRGAWKDAKDDVKDAKKDVKRAPPQAKKPKKVALRNAEAVADAAHDTWKAARNETRVAQRSASQLKVDDLAREASAGGRIARGAVGVSGLGVGALSITSGIQTLNREDAQANERVGAGLDIAGGTADIIGGGANVARAVGAGGAVVGNVAKYAGPVGMVLGGGANVVTGSVKAYDALSGPEKDYEKASQGGLKAIGGTMMVAGAGASLTGIGAAAGVPLMVAGGVITAGVAVWEWLAD